MSQWITVLSENKQHFKKAIKGLVTEEWEGQRETERDSEAPRDHQEGEAVTPQAWGHGAGSTY